MNQLVAGQAISSWLGVHSRMAVDERIELSYLVLLGQRGKAVHDVNSRCDGVTCQNQAPRDRGLILGSRPLT